MAKNSGTINPDAQKSQDDGIPDVRAASRNRNACKNGSMCRELVIFNVNFPTTKRSFHSCAGEYRGIPGGPKMNNPSPTSSCPVRARPARTLSCMGLK